MDGKVALKPLIGTVSFKVPNLFLCQAGVQLPGRPLKAEMQPLKEALQKQSTQL